MTTFKELDKELDNLIALAKVRLAERDLLYFALDEISKRDPACANDTYKTCVCEAHEERCLGCVARLAMAEVTRP